jgi:adenylate kinase family enzyme
MNQVIIVSGPPGAGKSAVAEAICERYDRMLHVEVDTLRHWVRAGYRHPWANDAQASEQLRLGRRNATAIARESIAMRYAVVIDDVALAADIEDYRELLRGIDAYVGAVTLLPALDVALTRDRGRSATIPERARALYAQFAEEAASGALPGAVIDSSADPDAAVTADRLQEVVASGKAMLLRPAEADAN